MMIESSLTNVAYVWTVQFEIFIIIIYMTKTNNPGNFILKIK